MRTYFMCIMIATWLLAGCSDSQDYVGDDVFCTYDNATDRYDCTYDIDASIEEPVCFDKQPDAKLQQLQGCRCTPNQDGITFTCCCQGHGP